MRCRPGGGVRRRHQAGVMRRCPAWCRASLSGLVLCVATKHGVMYRCPAQRHASPPSAASCVAARRNFGRGAYAISFLRIHLQ